MVTLKKIIFVLYIMTCSFMLLSCTANEQKVLKLGTVVWVGYEPLYLGREKGFIDSNEIKLVEFLSASQVLRAFKNNLIDVAALTIDEVMILLDEGFDASIFLVVDVSNGADVIIANKKFNSLKELKGRRIGYENTALGAYILSRALKMNGLTSRDVELIDMDVNETESALINNKVDGVVTFEPARSRLLEQGYKEVFSSREIPDEVVDVLVVRKEKLQQYKPVLKKLINGWFKSVEYMAANKKESLDIMNKRLGLSESAIINAFSGVKFPSKEENRMFLNKDINSSKLKKSIEQISKEMIQMKLINGEAEIDRLISHEILTQ